MLGGSPAINFGATVYLSKANFEAWEKLGNEGWGAGRIAPYLRKFSRFIPHSAETKKLLNIDYINEALHGKDGPLPITSRMSTGRFRRHGLGLLTNSAGATQTI